MIGNSTIHWFTIHELIATLGLVIYVMASHTLQIRRSPSAAIAWVVALLLLPYVALPLYLTFGQRKLQVCRLPTTRRALEGQDPGVDTLAGRARQLASIMGLPAEAGFHHLNLHADGRQALRALQQMIDQATVSIDICAFQFSGDAVGAEMCARLARRAREGIRVRVLVDGLGNYLGRRCDFKSLSAAGAQVAWFVPPLSNPMRGRSNLRNHRKMVISDSQRLWSGGRNIAAQYFTDRGGHAWIDLTFDLCGELAFQAQQQFEHDWTFATQGEAWVAKAAPPAPALPATHSSGQLISSGPDQKDDTFYTLLVSSFFLARQRILAVTPYFVPDPTLLMSLTLAVRRGVHVDLVLPRKSNHRLADMARHRALRELSAAGARVWLLPEMMHAKLVVIDDEVALAGSANLDQRSLFINYELMVAFYGKNDVRLFADWAASCLPEAELYQARAPRLWQEIAEGMLLWLAFQL